MRKRFISNQAPQASNQHCCTHEKRRDALLHAPSSFVRADPGSGAHGIELLTP
jgi:hypothetical protein